MLTDVLSPDRDDPQIDAESRRLGRAAVAALYDELALAPKPGLVSFADAGSHTDMDAATFLRSLKSLRGYFVEIAALGRAAAPFEALERCGREAERRMLVATGGVNTHRGAIFLLGLVCAAAASTGARPSADRVRSALTALWGRALLQRCARLSASNGSRAARAHGLRGASEEAALGFPVLFDTALPALLRARCRGADARRARLQCLFEVIAVLADTNLVHRGGLAALRFAQREAREFLDAGGVHRDAAGAHAAAIHRAFVARRLSPGGAADVLAAACFLERMGRAR